MGKFSCETCLSALCKKQCKKHTYHAGTGELGLILTTDEMNAQQIYHSITQTLLPRPIAWVLSQHTDGHFNVAPFSYFTAVSSEPPLLVFSVGDKAPGEGKDTKVNISNNPKFTVHIPSFHHAGAVTETSRTLPASESEVDSAKLELTDFAGFSLPRIANCSIAFGCRLHDMQTIKGAPQSLIFGYIEKIYIADNCAELQRTEKPDGSFTERLKVSAEAIDPLARLGGSQYGRLGELLDVPRPR